MDNKEAVNYGPIAGYSNKTTNYLQLSPTRTNQNQLG